MHSQGNLGVEDIPELTGGGGDHKPDPAEPHKNAGRDADRADAEPLEEHRIPQLFRRGAHGGEDPDLPGALVQGDAEGIVNEKDRADHDDHDHDAPERKEQGVEDSVAWVV